MKYVGYRRVSTVRQGQSGLGLDAQQHAIDAHVKSVGGRLLRTYTEVESGKNDARPELAAALDLCKSTQSTLIIAKLDRLARKVSFISTLMDAGTPFVCCDLPSANPLTIHILAAVAEAERKQISTRTREALAVAKARGTLLGGANPRCRNLPKAAAERGALIGGKVHKAAADAAARKLSTIVLSMRREGRSLAQIAAGLNEAGHLTRRGNPYTAQQVWWLVKRCQALAV